MIVVKAIEKSNGSTAITASVHRVGSYNIPVHSFPELRSHVKCLEDDVEITCSSLIHQTHKSCQQNIEVLLLCMAI